MILPVVLGGTSRYTESKAGGMIMLTLTEQAGAKVKEMLAEEEHPERLFLRIGVKTGGCTGLTYDMGFDEEKREDDQELHQHGVKILIDAESGRFLQGVKIDYKESLMGGGFVIDSPYATATCGCGHSFRTAMEAGKPDEKC